MMLHFWGYPSSEEESKSCTLNTAADFQGCMDLCSGMEWCMLSYGNDTTCILCDIYTISSITQSDSSKGIEIAVKVDVQNSCPVEIVSNVYTYKLFSSNAGVTRNNALASCETYGGWLAGFENIIDYNYIFNTARSLFPTPLNYQYLTVWISGLMKTSCQDDTGTANCAGIKAFGEFPNQNNQDLYRFPPGYPNLTKLHNGYYQRGLQLTWSQQLTAYNGMVTNAATEFACNGEQKICAFSYACGILGKA
ncbi:hypothetical protein B9Z55_012839 [Caenorhabditis nigoni]|nr:hypothetical protein B9Z55_012839 [Caenorhabditis nigoni]